MIEAATMAIAPWTLRDVLMLELPPILRKQHLNRDVIIGLVGDRGGGKSLGGGEICLFDYMMQGEPCFANMQIKASLNVDGDMAGRYGINGGQVVYQSKPLDKYKFLRFDPEYTGGVFFTHEINIWLADARRSASNLNLESTDICQELRKLKSAWIYDCIHEMFVDTRIRDNTDIFITTSDTALTIRGMAFKQKQGIEFEWWLHPMTRKGAAILGTDQYRNNNKFTKPLGPIYVRGRQLWGLIDTDKREHREKYVSQIGKHTPVDMELIDNPEIVEAQSKWGWLYQAIKELHEQGYDEIYSKDLWEFLRLEERGVPLSTVGRQLRDMKIKKRQAPPRMGGFYYIIDSFDLKRGLPKEKKLAIVTK